MKLENVVTRMGIPLERPFHDALSDTLYTADLCRMLDLRAGLAAYPSEEDTLRQSLCPTPGDYRDFRVFRGYLDQSMWKLDPVIGTMACPVCGTALQPDDVWLKKGSSGWYTLSQCPVCKAGAARQAGACSRNTGCRAGTACTGPSPAASRCRTMQAWSAGKSRKPSIWSVSASRPNGRPPKQRPPGTSSEAEE